LKVKSQQNKKKHTSAQKGWRKVFLIPLRKTAWWQRIGIFLIICALLNVIVLYSVAQWYTERHKNEPLIVGATFIPDYARYYGLNPIETMQAMIDELGIKRFRLVSYWDNGEPVEGEYIFDELDWQFALAEASGSKVSLAIGLRQPRWPECHMPKWAEKLPMEQWEPKLMEYTKAVMERYKNSPALESYQLENEFFLDVFGICPDHSRDRLIREYEYVKNVDPSHKVIVSRSNNALGLPIGDPRPDEFAVSVYKRVWDKTITKRYIEYPFPSWFYGALAGGGELLTGKNLTIHELQAEAWLPENKGYYMNDVDSVPEQNKSLNHKRLKDRIRYGEATGMRTMDLWGVEWWYWRKVKANDPSLWDTAQSELARIRSDNAKLSAD
jgi:hypothetical protein